MEELLIHIHVHDFREDPTAVAALYTLGRGYLSGVDIPLQWSFQIYHFVRLSRRTLATDGYQELLIQTG